MQKLRWLSVVGILCVVCSAIRGDSPISTLLSAEDYKLESTLQEEGRPALSSAITAKDQWESYDEWRCFPKGDVELMCVEIEYGGWRKSPLLIADGDDHRFEYDLDPTFKWDCEFTLNEWRRVIGDSSEVCLFGAYLPARATQHDRPRRRFERMTL
jgi:hypothetical protein